MKKHDSNTITKQLGDKAEAFNARGLDFLIKRQNGREGDRAEMLVDAYLKGALDTRTDTIEKVEQTLSLADGALRGAALLIFLLGRKPTLGVSGVGIVSSAISTELEEAATKIIEELDIEGVERGYTCVRKRTTNVVAEEIVGGEEAADAPATVEPEAEPVKAVKGGGKRKAK